MSEFLGGCYNQPVASSTFGAMMDAELVNDEPVTILVDSKSID